MDYQWELPKTSIQTPTKITPNHSDDTKANEHSQEKAHEAKVDRYKFSEVLDYLNKAGKSFYGKNFRIYPEDEPIIQKLAIYFFADKPNAEKMNINLNKGILLTGPSGLRQNIVDELNEILSPSQRPARYETLSRCIV